jgi:hypothetical protein
MYVIGKSPIRSARNMTAVAEPSRRTPPRPGKSLSAPQPNIWIPIAACAAILALALWTSGRKSLWMDEAYSLLTSQQSFAHTWHLALHFELQPPLYFLLLNAWLRVGGGTIEWARALSMLSVLGFVIVLWFTMRPMQFGRGLPAPLAAVLTATVVWAAAEARDYALLLLLSALSYWLLLRLVSGRTRHPGRDALWYAVVAYLSLLTMYYSGFVLFGQWVAALTVRRARWVVTASLAAVAIALIPWLGVILGQVAGHANLNPPFAVDVAQSHLPGGAVALVFRDLLGAVYAAAPVLNRPYAAFVFVILLALVPVIRLSRRNGGQMVRSPEERVLALTVAVSVVSFVLLRVSNIALVWPRHMTALTPGFILLWCLWTARAPSITWARIASALCIAVSVVTLASYEHDADVADSRGAASFVMRHGPSDPVLVIGPEAVFAFRYYYRGQDRGTAPVLGVPMDASLVVYNPDSVPLTDPSQIGARVAAAGVPRTFWLVVSKQFIWHSAAADSALQSFLRSSVTSRDSTDFKNIYVVHARRGGAPCRGGPCVALARGRP